MIFPLTPSHRSLLLFTYKVTLGSPLPWTSGFGYRKESWMKKKKETKLGNGKVEVHGDFRLRPRAHFARHEDERLACSTLVLTYSPFLHLPARRASRTLSLYTIKEISRYTPSGAKENLSIHDTLGNNFIHSRSRFFFRSPFDKKKFLSFCIYPPLPASAKGCSGFFYLLVFI